MTKVMWTVVQAGKVLGLRGPVVRRLLASGELTGTREGRPGAVYQKRQANWQVDPDSVKAYLAREAERKALAKAKAQAAVPVGAVLKEAKGAIDLRPVLREIRDAILALGREVRHDGRDSAR